MTHFKFKLLCEKGSDWGQRGQISSMCAQANTVEEAAKLIEKQIPGGWTYTLVGETTDTYFLSHTNDDVKRNIVADR